MSRWDDLPGWEWVGPTPSQGPAMRRYRGLVLHIAEGSYAGTVSWQRNPSAKVSSHFIVSTDGTIGQMVDTATAAWTQAAGNGEWISVECAGWSGDPLTDAQVEAVAHIYARGVREHGWPLASTDSPAGAGLGWHGMGGVAWGGHPNCPGQPVLAQRPAILARAREILEGDPMYGSANPWTLHNLDRWLTAVLNNTAQVTGVRDPSGQDVGPITNVLHRRADTPAPVEQPLVHELLAEAARRLAKGQ